MIKWPLKQEQKPSFSVQLDDSVCIKDLRWARNVAKVYVILSARGGLFYGSGHGPLSHVMENVDSGILSIMYLFVFFTLMCILYMVSLVKLKSWFDLLNIFRNLLLPNISFLDYFSYH